MAGLSVPNDLSNESLVSEVQSKLHEELVVAINALRNEAEGSSTPLEIEDVVETPTREIFTKFR